MSRKSSILQMVLRAILFVVLPAAALPALIAANLLWPESEYLRVWNPAISVLYLAVLVAWFVTRSRRK